MRFKIVLTSIIFGLLIHDVFSNVVSECESGDATRDNIKRDLCYVWRTKQYPFWAGPVYKDLLKKETEKFFFKKGKLLMPAEINEKCKTFPKHILDPEHIQIHFEICYYAKHGFWFSICKNEHEEKERLKLLNKYVIVGGKRINQRDVKLLCPDNKEMNCPLCKKEKEQMCHYAASGFWTNNEEPDKNCQNRFFYIGDSWIYWQEIWNKCTNYFKGKPFSIESVHYPLCSYTTIPSTNSPTTETLPPNTPLLNTPRSPHHHCPLKTITTNIPSPETSPQTFPPHPCPLKTSTTNIPSPETSQQTFPPHPCPLTRTANIPSPETSPQTFPPHPCPLTRTTNIPSPETSPQTFPPHSCPLKTSTTIFPSPETSPQYTTPPSDFTLPLSTFLSIEISPPTNPPPGTPPPITTPYAWYITDETLQSEPSLENSLPLWYYPNESTQPKKIPIAAPKPSKTLSTPSTSSTTTTTTSTNLPPTSTKSTTLTWTTKWRTFTNHADYTTPTLDTTQTKPNTTIITTPTIITSTTDLTTVEETVCSTCSLNKDTCQCNEKYLHLHVHIDGNDSILTKEVLKILKLFNGEKNQ